MPTSQFSLRAIYPLLRMVVIIGLLCPEVHHHRNTYFLHAKNNPIKNTAAFDAPVAGDDYCLVTSVTAPFKCETFANPEKPVLGLYIDVEQSAYTDRMSASAFDRPPCTDRSKKSHRILPCSILKKSG